MLTTYDRAALMREFLGVPLIMPTIPSARSLIEVGDVDQFALVPDTAGVKRAVYSDGLSTWRALADAAAAGGSGGGGGGGIGVSIADHGADPEASASVNVAALNDAVAYAAARNLPVYVPPMPTPFLIDDAIALPAEMTVNGSGWQSQIKQTLINTNAFIAATGCVLDNVHLIGPGGISPVTNGSGTFGQNIRRLIVRNSFFGNWGEAGIFLREPNDYRINDNLFYGNGNYNFPSAGLTTSSDIFVSSNAPSGRAILHGNFCLSDNSQAMFISSNGWDALTTITGNVCIALNMATGAELPSGPYDNAHLNRRHGILFGYTTEAAGGRAVIANNIVRNTNTSGIYTSNHDAPGVYQQIVITGNQISNTGYGRGSDDTVSAAIEMTGAAPAGLIVANNAIENYRGYQPAHAAAIKITGGTPAATPSDALIVNNTIDGSTAYGIRFGDGTGGGTLRIAGNSIRNCDFDDIVIEGNVDFKTKTVISGNMITRKNVDRPSIYVDVATAAGTDPRTTIEHNELTGFGPAVPAGGGQYNAAIYVRRPDRRLTMRLNRITNYRYGLYFEGLFAAGRDLDTVIVADNHYDSCVAGVYADAGGTAATRIACSNRYTNISYTNMQQPTYRSVYEGRVDNGRAVVCDLNAAPTLGTWAVGDRVEFTTPTGGGNFGAVCTTAGAPGTWNTYGEVAAEP